MELVLKLNDEAKLGALLTVLRRFTASEGVELAVESLERRAILAAPQAEFDWAKWDDIMNRDKLRPGEPPMTEEEEVAFINQAVKETRAERRAAQQNA